MEAAQLVDAAVRQRVLVLGPFPPEGRDLDLVTRRSTRHDVVAALEAGGFLPRGSRLSPPRRWVEQWVKFGGGSAYAVDVHAAERWGVPAGEIDALFEDAEPIAGMANLVVCAPHHVLLLTARRLARRGGRLEGKRRARIERALAEAPHAWTAARQRAPRWGLTSALGLLEAAYETGAPVPTRARARAQGEMVAAGRLAWRARWVTRHARGRAKRRPVVVSLSGLDGAGKSSQATALRETLEKLGVNCVIEWMPLGHSPRNPTLHRIRRTANRALALARRLRRARSSAHTGAAGPSAEPNPARTLRQQSELVTQAWATIVALMQAWQHRRAVRRHRGTGRIVIFDRYTLDSAAQLRFFYGDSHRFPFQKWLLRILSPKPQMLFLLDVRPETLMRRKELQYTLDEVRAQTRLYRQERRALCVRRLDGERPRTELSDEIASAVWRGVGR
jgi:thymidylate kinase